MRLQPPPFCRHPLFVSLVLPLSLLLIGLLLYLPALPNHFVWDDEEQVVQNEAVHSLAHLPELLAGSTFNSGGAAQLGGLYYKPLMSLSFAIIYTLAGPAPGAFHLFQLGLHLDSALLVYWLFWSLWRRRWVAWLGALIWLVHPQNVETVVYISSLQDTLYLFFGLVGLGWVAKQVSRAATAGASHSPSASPTSSALGHSSSSPSNLTWLDLGLAGVCVFLAILGKETGGLFGLLIALYLWLYGERRQVWRWGVVWALVMSLYLYLRLGVAHVVLSKNVFTPMATLPLWARIGNAPGIVWHYLSEWFWPARLAISQHWANPHPGLVELLALAGFAAGWWLIWWWGKNRPAFTFWWVWLGLGLGFHLQLFPLDMTVADRWFYLPMLGLIGSIGSLIAGVTFKPRAVQLYLGVGVCLAILLYFRSATRIRNWHDGLTLYSHDSQIMRQSFDLENNLGVELYRAGETAAAAQHFQRSTELAPAWWTNWNNLGVTAEAAGQLAAAATDYQKAIQNGNYYLAYGNYAQILLKQGKYTDALVFLEHSLELYPNNQQLLNLYYSVKAYLADPFRESRASNFKP